MEYELSAHNSKAKPPYAHRHAVGLRLGKKLKCGHNQPLLTRNSQTHENARGHSDKGTRLLRQSLKKISRYLPIARLGRVVPISPEPNST